MKPEYDPLDLRAQEAADSLDDDAKRLQQQLDEDDFKWIMQDKRGRRFMWRLLGLAGVFVNPFTAARESTDFNCGKQIIGQTMIAEIHRLCSEHYHVMVKEQQKHGKRRTRSPSDN